MYFMLIFFTINFNQLRPSNIFICGVIFSHRLLEMSDRPEEGEKDEALISPSYLNVVYNRFSPNISHL